MRQLQFHLIRVFIECLLHIKHAVGVGGSIRSSFNTKHKEVSIVNKKLKVPFGVKGRRNPIYLGFQPDSHKKGACNKIFHSNPLLGGATPERQKGEQGKKQEQIQDGSWPK